jgi:hypothetical protein
MKKRQGAPRKPAAKAKRELIQIRVGAAEKAAFVRASDLDGKKLSEWIRDRLRKTAQNELERHGENIPFFPTQAWESR